MSLTTSSGKKKGLAKVIVVTSGKGGTGKTTTTASLGAALALKGMRTLLIDADIGLRNLDVILGLENRIVFNIVDVAKGVCKPSQAIIKSKKSPNLSLLPASQTDDKDIISEEEIKDVIEKYKRDFHFILIDSPAGIEQGFKNAMCAADSALIVATPEVSSIRDADRVVGLLSAEGLDVSLIINRLDYNLVCRGDMLSVEDVQEILGVDLVGVVERDDDVIVAANCGEPVTYNNKSRAANAFNNIAKRLCGESIPLETFNKSFFSRLGRRFGMA